MPANADRLQFAPPPAPGMLRALGFAIAAHVLLMLALTWGINWKRDPENLSAEAELWSRVPQEAAPRLVEVAPPPPPPPPPVPVPAPPPPAVAAPAPAPAPAPEPGPDAADIALERAKEQKAEARRKLLALERERKREEQKQLAAQKKLEAQQAQQEAQQEAQAQRKLQARQQADAAKAEAAQERQKLDATRKQRLAEDAKRLEAQREAKLRQAEDARRLEAQREANLRRIQGLANSTGGPESQGGALHASGPSSSYGGRVAARVKPNIVFGEEIAGNPKAEIEVRTSPDGTIVSQRVVKSSGVKSWDEAVLKAVIKTEVLPRDVDGRVPSALIIGFRPKD